METLRKARKSDNPLRAQVNKHFVIRWKYQEEKRFRLIGAGRYHLLVGDDLKAKHFDHVLQMKDQAKQYKIRERLIIQFSAK